MRHAIETHGGYVFKTVGDAFCAAFASAGDAVGAAGAAQLALVAEPWPAETPIRVRPVENALPYEFEIVSGHRRHAAAARLQHGGEGRGRA